MKKLRLFLFFLIINFGCLALGSCLMGSAVTDNWYVSLNKAPWTPPGWVFGAAWTTIMVCFSIYLTYLFTENTSNSLQITFSFQVLLNVIWNFIFFNQHLILLGLIIILALTVVIFYLFFRFKLKPTSFRYLLLPYMVWLLIASSLNTYILIYN